MSNLGNFDIYEKYADFYNKHYKSGYRKANESYIKYLYFRLLKFLGKEIVVLKVMEGSTPNSNIYLFRYFYSKIISFNDKKIVRIKLDIDTDPFTFEKKILGGVNCVIEILPNGDVRGPWRFDSWEKFEPQNILVEVLKR